MGVEVDINIFLGVSRGGINRRELDIVVVGVEVVGSRSRSSSSRSNIVKPYYIIQLSSRGCKRYTI